LTQKFKNEVFPNFENLTQTFKFPKLFLVWFTSFGNFEKFFFYFLQVWSSPIKYLSIVSLYGGLSDENAPVNVFSLQQPKLFSPVTRTNIHFKQETLKKKKGIRQKYDHELVASYVTQIINFLKKKSPTSRLPMEFMNPDDILLSCLSCLISAKFSSIASLCAQNS
jgi:hypothetical protein